MENVVISCMEFSIVSSESYFSKSLCSLTEINDSIFLKAFEHLAHFFLIVRSLAKY